MSYSHILPNLYLGNQYASSVLHPIDAILSIGCNHKSLQSELNTFKVSIVDSYDSDITSNLGEATQFIHSMLVEDKIILVHCKGGINRSPAFIVAYLVKYGGFTLVDAIAFVKSKRKGARFQAHYIAQIESWLING